MCLGANNLAFSSDGSAIVKRTVELLLQANSLWLWLRLTSPPHSRELPEKTSFFSFFQNNHGLRDFIPIFMSLYGGDSRLFFAEFRELWSQGGSQQDCPLGGLLFILGGWAASRPKVAVSPRHVVQACGQPRCPSSGASA